MVSDLLLQSFFIFYNVIVEQFEMCYHEYYYEIDVKKCGCCATEVMTMLLWCLCLT